MKTHTENFTERQLLFKELFVGTLIYAVVLGFFNDYTSMVDAVSFSTILFAAFVLELLTYMAFRIKNSIVARLKQPKGIGYKLSMIFCIWLVMFLSKFVFVWVIDFVFRGNITISGFFATLLLVVSVTVTHKLADILFVKLGQSNPAA